MSVVSLKMLENEKRVQEVVYGHQYTLRAEISKPDGKLTLHFKPWKERKKPSFLPPQPKIYQ